MATSQVPMPQFPDDPNFVLQNSDTGALLNQQKQWLVSQFPALANDPDFNGDLSDAFSRFVNQGTQSGSDYNDIWAKTVAPTVAKWQARASQDTAKLQEGQEMAALKVAKDTGSPTAAVQAFPQLISPASKFRAEWVGRINKADEGPAKLSPQDAALLGATKDAYTEALKSGDTQTADDLKKQIVNFKPSLSRQSTLTPSPAVAPVPTAQPTGPGVAAPMGTSGYVNYDVPAGMRPQGSTFIGSPTPQQAAQLLQQWQNRAAAPPMSASLAPPGPPPGIAPPPAAAPAGPAVAPAPAPAPQLHPVTMQNSGLLGVGLNRLKNFMSNSPSVEQFLHGDDPQAMRTYVAAHPELDPQDKKTLLDRAANMDFANANTAKLLTGVKQLGSNIGTSGQLVKDALVGTSEAPLPLPQRQTAAPGSAQNNPVKPATKAKAAALPSGTWIQDPAGNVFQKQ